jgi:type IV pilus assembly protein PilB
MQPATHGDRLMEILLLRKAVKADALAEAREEAESTGTRLEKILVQRNLVSGVDMALSLSEYLNLPPIQLTRYTPDAHLIEQFSRELLQRHRLLPMSKTDTILIVAMGDPFDVVGLESLHAMTGLDVVPMVAPEKDVADVLQKMVREPTQGLEDILRDVGEGDVEVGREKQDEVSLEDMMESAEDAPVIRIVNSIMVEALRKHASDIHIEPFERAIRLRYRVDGVMYESHSPPKHLQSAIISRLKIMSNLNIAERRVPQDGRFKIRAMGKEADVRVSILPTVHGEKVVMRILDKSALAANLGSLGLDPRSLDNLRYAIASRTA